MKKLVLFLTAVIGLTTVNSCTKDNVPTPTSLEITLLNDSGNTMTNASVKLYSSEEDMKNGTNQVGTTQLSNESGVVRFSDLSNIKYYWFAEKGCENNANSIFTTASPLTLNTNNEVNVIMSGTGNVRLESTSTNPYQVYINGVPVFEMSGGSTREIYFMPIGSYSIRILQLSGYLIYPTDETYTVILGCGHTKEVIFPQTRKADS